MTTVVQPGNGGFGGGGAGAAGGTMSLTGRNWRVWCRKWKFTYNGRSGSGGGGAALGGAIFVMNGATLNVAGVTQLTNNIVQAGESGGGTAQPGLALGQDFFLMSGATLVFSPAAPLTIATDIASDSGAGGGSGGGVICAGPSILTLSGSNGYTGGTTVQGGTLVLNGSVVGNVVVDASGTLKGTGTVGSNVNPGNVTNSGIFSPGNSIGTFNITGNYTQNASAGLIIEVNPSGATDLVNVTGTASLNGSLSVLLDPGNYTQGETFVFLSAPAGVSGTFSSNITFIAGNPGGRYIPSVDYFPTFVELTLNLYPSFASIATRGNPHQIAEYFDQIAVFPGTDIANVFFDLHNLSNSNLIDALDQLQPSLFGALSLTEQESATMVNSAFMHRTAELHGIDCERQGFPEKKHCIWGEGFDLYSRQERYGQQVGFHTDNPGGAVGIDYRFRPDFYIGGIASYTHANLHWHRSRGRAHINSWYGGVYGTFFRKSFFMDASIMYGTNLYKTKRNIKFSSIDRTATGSHRGYTILANVNGGWNIRTRKTFIQPFFRLDNFYIHENDFRERQAQSLDLHVHCKNSEMLRSELGINLSECFKFKHGRVVPLIKGSWVRESRFNNKHYTAALKNFEKTYGTFEVTTNVLNRDLFSPGIGLTGIMGDGAVSLSAFFEGAVGSDYSQYDGSARLEIRF